MKLCPPDAFLHSSSSFRHLVVDPLALSGQMVYLWAPKQLLGSTGLLFLLGGAWNTSTQKWQKKTS